MILSTLYLKSNLITLILQHYLITLYFQSNLTILDSQSNLTILDLQSNPNLIHVRQKQVHNRTGTRVDARGEARVQEGVQAQCGGTT